MKVREYEQLTKEEKIRLLEDQRAKLMAKPRLDICEFNALSLIGDDIRRLRRKRSCCECGNHGGVDNFCSYYGKMVVDFAPSIDSLDCHGFKEMGE